MILMNGFFYQNLSKTGAPIVGAINSIHSNCVIIIKKAFLAFDFIYLIWYIKSNLHDREPIISVMNRQIRISDVYKTVRE